MTVKEWQDRLQETFGQGGITGASLLNVMASEQDYAEFLLNNCYGYLVMADSFLSFYMDTLQLADSQHRKSTVPRQWHGLLLLEHAGTFRTFRAAENLFHRGYPLTGYGVFRELKHQAIVFAAIARRTTTHYATSGLRALNGKGPQNNDDMFKIEVTRRQEEKKILEKTIGKKSGLDPADIDELWLWEKMFHQEIHGFRLTFATDAKAWMENRGPLPLEPNFDLPPATMYVNRGFEIGWMLLRSLPFLQLQANAFGKEWADKWHILDDSFRYSVESFVKTGKKIATAFIHLINAKFQFSPETTVYQE